MFCYGCSEKIGEGEHYCRNCGAESLILRSNVGQSWSATAGYFLLGSVVFGTVFIALSAILSILFPNAGPQLVVLTLILLALPLAGSWAVLYKRLKDAAGVREPGKLIDPVRSTNTLPTEAVPRLEERFPIPPASVTDRTTTELEVKSPRLL